MPVLVTTVSNNKSFLSVRPSLRSQQPAGRKWTGLIDTGATRTLLGSNVWRDAGLVHESRDYGTARGYDGKPEQRKLFWCDLHLFDPQMNTVVVPNLRVMGGDPLAPDDVLIGMDVLEHCVLTLDGHSSTVTMIFP